MTDNTSGKKLYLIDAYALIYRSYFAFIRNPRFNSNGQNTSAMLGFVNTLEQLIEQEKPTHIAVVFDVHADTFRHEMYPEYKANRETMPEDLRASIPYIRKLIQAYNIPIVEKEGFEADDVIGTLAQKAKSVGFKTYMFTPDKDYAQLVEKNIYMLKPKSGASNELWGVDEVMENFNIDHPRKVIDILGLMGDASDNVPGCPGIGPKTAMKLIGQFGSVEGIYENIDQLKGKQKENLEGFKDQVLLSKKLVTINVDVPLDFSWDSMVMGNVNKSALCDIFKELEFRSLLAKYSTTNLSPDFEQGTLFGGFGEEEKKELESHDINNVDHSYFVVENEQQRASLRAELAVSPSFCFDTETTNIDAHKAELVCISFSLKAHEAYCVLLPDTKEEAMEIVKEFSSIFEDENIIKIGQNLKYDLLVLWQYGIQTKGPFFDTMVAHYLIQPELRHNLDYLSEIYFNYKKVATEDLIGKKGRNQLSMRQVAVDELVKYACEDADLTYQLYEKLDEELVESGTAELFKSIEMPLLWVLLRMELNGALIDKAALNTYATQLKEEILKIEQEIYKLAGEEFLISSPKQLGIVLFDHLKIDPNAKKTKTKQYSTSEEVLQRLSSKHPIINEVLTYRGLRKLLNTYVEVLPTLVNERTGKIHTSYNQTVTSTGRLSSNNPNLQNIPIRDEYGRYIRKAFIPANGNIFLSADYSQIELRIMAALSEDENMIKAFVNNEDIHAATASKIFNVDLDEVTSDMRRKAKTANFGIIYGISAFGLSQRLNISRSEAKEIIDGYFDGFPGVKSYVDKCIEEARKEGVVRTILGRKRYLKEINSSNSVVRGVAERNAINTPIQGSAADIIKVAMINIQNAMEKDHLKSTMILQVHDELNFDVFREELAEMKKIVQHEMENAVKLSVPLTVDIDTGDNWLEAH